MNRTVLFVFGISIAIVVVILAALAYSEQHLSNPAQMALDRYLQYRNSTTSQFVQPAQLIHATMPSKFTREMSGTSFGDSHFYQTMVDYSNPVNVNLPNLATATPGLTSATYWRGSTPIPYPPEDAWCAVLKEEDQPEQIVIVALHQSLYNAEWLVHQPPAKLGSAEMNIILSTIGCELKAGQ